MASRGGKAGRVGSRVRGIDFGGNTSGSWKSMGKAKGNQKSGKGSTNRKGSGRGRSVGKGNYRGTDSRLTAKRFAAGKRSRDDGWYNLANKRNNTGTSKGAGRVVAGNFYGGRSDVKGGGARTRGEKMTGKASLDTELDGYFGRNTIADQEREALDKQLDRYFSPAGIPQSEFATPGMPGVPTKEVLDNELDDYFSGKKQVPADSKEALDRELESYFEGDKTQLVGDTSAKSGDAATAAGNDKKAGSVNSGAGDEKQGSRDVSSAAAERAKPRSTPANDKTSNDA
eukprot:TRINITY_DN58780_c0_g1_i1.p1 TRINITY_DN58780_c0_g1~~TRINITY_DN58780_c0_g1_i1.p1  ORF type:complete len:312 (+),score=60.02 TRINITY_DN58780_c0_g1_i1:83-937(+)